MRRGEKRKKIKRFPLCEYCISMLRVQTYLLHESVSGLANTDESHDLFCWFNPWNVVTTRKEMVSEVKSKDRTKLKVAFKSQVKAQVWIFQHLSPNSTAPHTSQQKKMNEYKLLCSIFQWTIPHYYSIYYYFSFLGRMFSMLPSVFCQQQQSLYIWIW